MTIFNKVGLINLFRFDQEVILWWKQILGCEKMVCLQTVTSLAYLMFMRDVVAKTTLECMH